MTFGAVHFRMMMSPVFDPISVVRIENSSAWFSAAGRTVSAERRRRTGTAACRLRVMGFGDESAGDAHGSGQRKADEAAGDLTHRRAGRSHRQSHRLAGRRHCRWSAWTPLCSGDGDRRPRLGAPGYGARRRTDRRDGRTHCRRSRPRRARLPPFRSLRRLQPAAPGRRRLCRVETGPGDRRPRPRRNCRCGGSAAGPDAAMLPPARRLRRRAAENRRTRPPRLQRPSWSRRRRYRGVPDARPGTVRPAPGAPGAHRRAAAARGPDDADGDRACRRRRSRHRLTRSAGAGSARTARALRR